MTLSRRESNIIAYALNCLIIDGHPDLAVSSVELGDIAQKVINSAREEAI